MNHRDTEITEKSGSGSKIPGAEGACESGGILNREWTRMDANGREWGESELVVGAPRMVFISVVFIRVYSRRFAVSFGWGCGVCWLYDFLIIGASVHPLSLSGGGRL